ncbi:helix-turn-helix domain-containing protein [Aliarcobacter butzleri]|uniref:helix-turn-helix domain-containing protein n=1 Tax=Aliarcobacter butzleri TaxID=28197 RepID=UPI001EDC0DF9|nr:helix-turn-helix domain-containing protein [Aliarcobacter butzleri]MCG3710387.1 helix-turn-helix domain containing protein [Aliarcobacter butzleri]MCG3715036.1 helix-turn-helix domain containing protein [Aliarcobacter butzleri]
MEINDIIDKLFDYFKVTSIQDLAEKMNVSQPTISKWKTRNAISAIKKRCRELGIYNEIFGNLNTDIQSINTISGGQNAQSVHGNQIQDLNNKFSDIDDATIGLFIEAYKKAKKTNDIKGLRLHLMEYSDE